MIDSIYANFPTISIAEAKPLYERALAGNEKALGADHPGTLKMANSLGAFLLELDAVAEARALFERALAGYEASLGSGHLDTLAVVDNFADLLSETGEVRDEKEDG